MSARLDHLVIAAHTLEQGADWCERLLGVAFGPGGKHVAMGSAVGPDGVSVAAQGTALRASFDTPHGVVQLSSDD